MHFLDFLSIFILVSGFIIGLGAVTVIDTLGFLGRHSSYWTETTVRTHRVTKPLIWVGIALVIIGTVLLYRTNLNHPDALLHYALEILLVANGVFLSFWVSPRLIRREQQGRASELLPVLWQRYIFISFLISFSGWWGNVLLFILRYVK